MTDELIAVVATPEERVTRDRLTHEAWGQRLTAAAFVEREERLRRTPFASAAMLTWLLVHRDDRGTVLASLETFRVRSRHGAQLGWSYEVASVYTEPVLRSRGHASLLLTLVIEACHDAQAFTLYSDVGESLYARAGFAPRPAWDLVLPAGSSTGTGVQRGDDATALLGARAWNGSYALLPDALQLDWHRERERIYAEKLALPTLEHAVLTCAGGHALLAADLKHGRLYVLDLVATSEDSLHRLVDASRDEASRVALHEVVLWETPALAGRIDAHRTPRDGALPMLRPLAHGLDSIQWTEIPRLLWV